MKSLVHAFTSGLLAASLALAAAPGAALACDWMFCGHPADTLPERGAQVTVPANAALLWAPVYLGGDLEAALEALRVVDAATGAAIEIDVTPVDLPRFYGHHASYVIQPASPLTPGAGYRLETPSTVCGDPDEVMPWGEEEPLTVHVVAAAPADPPAALGVLTADAVTRGPLEVASDGPCQWTVDASMVRVSLELDAVALPWADLLAYETRVNGAPWTPSAFSGWGFPAGSSWVGRGEDLLFAICSEPVYAEHAFLLPGTHTVELKARLPGTDVVLTSNTITVALTCAGSGGEVPDPEGGVPAPDSRGAAGGCTATGGGPALPAALVLALLALLAGARPGTRRRPAR